MRLNSAPARQRFNEGVRDGLPLAIGALPWGLTFGLLVAQLGLRPLDTWLQTLLMSAWWFSGTAQFVALGLWQPPISIATLGALALAVFGVNARYLLQSTALAPWFAGLPAWKKVGALFFLVDASFALATQRFAAHGRDVAYFMGVSITNWSAWVVSSVIGALLPVGLINAEKWGLDFAMAAVLIGFAGGRLAGLGAATLRKTRGWLPWVLAAASAFFTQRWFGGNAHILVGAIVGATSAAWLAESKQADPA